MELLSVVQICKLLQLLILKLVTKNFIQLAFVKFFIVTVDEAVLHANQKFLNLLELLVILWI